MNNPKKKIILIVISIIIIIGIVSSLIANKVEIISEIDSYNKEYYIEKYDGDLDSNLAIFPNENIKFIDAKFYSSLKVGLFDTDGFILLTTKYSQEDYNSEINRLKNISMKIHNNCKENITYENQILYNEESYEYPAYITIDGFGNTYEYALLNEQALEISYIYLAYPSMNNEKYQKYLKIDKSDYSKGKTLDKYSMYNHSFDNGKSYTEFDDCKRK